MEGNLKPQHIRKMASKNHAFCQMYIVMQSVNKPYPFKQFVSAPFECIVIDFVKPSEVTNGRLSYKQEFIYMKRAVLYIRRQNPSI